MIPHRLLTGLAVSCLPLVVACADPSGSSSAPATYNTAGTDSGGSSSGGSSSSGSSSSGSSSGISEDFPSGPDVQALNNDDYYHTALKLINATKKRLDVVQYLAKSGSLVDSLFGAVEQAHARGVDVRVIFENEIDGNEDARARLAAKGVPVRLDSSARTTHAKIIYADGAMIVGSSNWSDTSIKDNNEANLLVRHKLTRDRFGEYLDKLWKSTSSPIHTTLSTSKIGAPYTDQGYFDVASKLIKKASKHIEITSYAMNLNPFFKDGAVKDLVNELVAAKQRGATVRIILDQSPWEKQNTELNVTAIAELKKLGLTDSRLDPEQTITHAKLLIVDDAVIVGTNNWSKGGFEDYHEAGVRTYETAVVDTMLAYFEGIWSKSK